MLLGISGILTLLFILWAKRHLRRSFPYTQPTAGFRLFGMFLRLLLSLRYRITVKGAEALNGPGPILFLPNHPALIDPIIIYALSAKNAPRPLADERHMRGFMDRWAAERRIIKL